MSMKGKSYLIMLLCLWMPVSCGPDSESAVRPKRLDELYAGWRRHVDANSHRSKSTAYTNCPEFRSIVEFGPACIPYLKEKIEADDGLDFMLSLAVIEIMKWDPAEFSLTELRRCREQVLNRLNSDPSKSNYAK